MTTTQRAIIIGSSSGLGAIHAQRLARCGYDVLLVARDASRLAARAGDISGCGREATVIVTNLTKPTDLACRAAALSASPTADVRD